jgi:hypothetical protein
MSDVVFLSFEHQVYKTRQQKNVDYQEQEVDWRCNDWMETILNVSQV